MDTKVRDSSELTHLSVDIKHKCALEKIRKRWYSLRWKPIVMKELHRLKNKRNKRKVSSAPSTQSRPSEKNQICGNGVKSSVEDRGIFQEESVELRKDSSDPTCSVGSSIQTQFHSNFNQDLGKRSLTSVDEFLTILLNSSPDVNPDVSGHPESKMINIRGKPEDEAKSQLEYIYLQAKEFQHFQYILNLMRGCISRMEKVRMSEDQTNLVLAEDVSIRIGIIGKYTDQNLCLLSKKKVKFGKPEDKDIWKESPLICFQNDLSLNSAIKILQGESACHKILIKTGNFCNETNKREDSVIITTESKSQILTAITTCLEEPICLMLQEWADDLKKEGLNKQKYGVVAEIEAIRKQMRLRKKDTVPAISLTSTGYQTIVPENINEFLFGRSGVNAFGIWKNSSFKVLVNLLTDKDILRDELTKLNRHFFIEFHLEIENGKLVEKRTLKQGDPVMPELPKRGKKYVSGTLGGFVTKSDNKKKIYALTCNHVIPNTNTHAYAKFSREYREIGTCVFTTREKSCDFAAVKINESVSDQCDVNFRRDDKKKRNARVYTESLEALGLVHKIGAETDVTNGSICSTEFYNTSSDDDNRECYFLVKGTQGNFSEEGDSGSLVFSRSMDVEQSYVEVVGMVYGNDTIVSDNDSDESQSSASPKYVEDKKEKRKDEKSLKYSHVRENVSEPQTELSACFRIHTAIELLKVDQGAHFEVKFKDDVSSASSSEDSFDENA